MIRYFSMNTYNPNHIQQVINFRVGQKVVVFDSDNKILFLRRSNKCTRAGGWDFPGGGLENEEPDEGIRREAREEAGIEIREVIPVTSISHESKDPGIRILLIGYVAKLKSGKIKLSWEHDDYRWLTAEEAVKVDLPKGHRKFLKAAIEFSKANLVPISFARHSNVL